MVPVSQGPTKEQLEEQAVVRGLQLRTNAVAYAVSSFGGGEVTTDEILVRARTIAAYIDGG